MHDTAPVVAGIAENDPAVLAFAFEEAERWQVPLQLVHTYLVPPTAMGSFYGLDIPAAYREAADEVVVEAQAFVADRHPTVPTQTTVLRGTASEALKRLSHSARTIVIGPDLAKPWALRLFEGRTAQALVRHAACPVAIVPGSWEPHVDDRPVVVLLDGISLSEAPLHYACEAARRRGSAVRVVQVDPPLTAVPDLEVQLERATERVERWCAEHPDVPLELWDLTGDPAGVAEASEATAALLVISRSLARPRAWSSTSAARAIAQSATCPVVVVPPTYGAES